MGKWIKVSGTPYSQLKKRGRKAGLDEWSKAIIDQTKTRKPVRGSHRLEVLFVLPEDKFPKDHPYGNDLDNLTKRFMDALQETVLKNDQGGDGIVVEVRAQKCREAAHGTRGAWFRLTRCEMPTDPQNSKPDFDGR